MFVFENIFVSDEILDARFGCDLAACRGLCCTGGDAGAPLHDAEARLFIKNQEELLKMPDFIAKRIRKYGVVDEVYIKRLDKKIYCTSTVQNGDCVFSIVENDIYYCYFQKNVTKFKKPSSCYLFPIREKRASNSIYLNLHVYDECRLCYNKTKEPLVLFLKNVLIDEYGKKFYCELEKELMKRNGL